MKKAAAFMILLCCFAAGAFAQQRKQRLIAILTYVDTAVPGGHPDFMVDSMYLSYSGARHSTFDYNTLDYFNVYGPLQNDISALPGLVAPNNIDSTYYPFATKADSILDFQGPGGLGRFAVASYFPDGSVRQLMQGTGGYSYADTFDFRYFYGDLIRVRHSWVDTIDASSERFLVRDAYGDVVVDSIAYLRGGIPQNAPVVYIDYDSLHHYTLISGGIIYNGGYFPGYGIVYTYYPDGKLRSILGPASGGHQVDSFLYTRGVQGFTTRISTQYVGATDHPMGPSSYIFSHVDALERKDTMFYVSNYIGYVSDSTIVSVEYNSLGNPVSTTRTSISHNPGRTIYTEKRIYHYEFYDEPAGLAGTPSGTSPITLSPNPTTGTITLRYADVPKARLQIIIINTLGQVVHTESFFPQGLSSDLILGDVPPGVYYITVSGPKAVLYKGSFMKQ